MTQSGDHNDDDTTLVGEYALHLLDAESRLAFEKRLRDEPDLRVLLREWDEGLVHLADDIPEVTPPAHLKSAIDARLFGATEPAPRFSLAWFFGHKGSVFAVVAMLVLAAYFGPSMLDDTQAPTYTAEIAAEDRALVVTASFDPNSGEIDINRIVGSAAEGRVLELWLIADGAPAPVSLGVLPASENAMISVPQTLIAAMNGGTLAISDEPTGGSPTGAPTGAVLAVGTIISS
ncbi:MULTISPECIES: anti-sigma factor [Falsihalocynthiibacter]|uniref:anti-sigma factor n=1 Tax=Falsihalocynthiibacter TaxID=2854182 RepID=UPI0030027992